MNVSYQINPPPESKAIELRLVQENGKTYLLANKYYVLRFHDDGTIERVSGASASGMNADDLGRVKLSDYR